MTCDETLMMPFRNVCQVTSMSATRMSIPWCLLRDGHWRALWRGWDAMPRVSRVSYFLGWFFVSLFFVLWFNIICIFVLFYLIIFISYFHVHICLYIFFSLCLIFMFCFTLFTLLFMYLSNFVKKYWNALIRIAKKRTASWRYDSSPGTRPPVEKRYKEPKGMHKHCTRVAESLASWRHCYYRPSDHLAPTTRFSRLNCRDVTRRVMLRRWNAWHDLTSVIRLADPANRCGI